MEKWKRFILYAQEDLRQPLIIHFARQANLLDSDLHQEKAALTLIKAHFPSLLESKNLLPANQKQLLELAL